MSTLTQTPEVEATNEELKEFLAAPETPSAKPAKKKRNVWYRIFALLVAIAPIVIYALLPADVLLAKEGGGYVVFADKKLWEIFIAMFTENGLAQLYADAAGVGAAATPVAASLFGIIPLVNTAGSLGFIASVILYVIPVAMVFTLILAIIALFSGKCAPGLARTITYVNFWTYFGYAASIVVIGYYVGHEISLDYAALAVVGVAMILYLIFSACKVGKRAFGAFVLFLLTVGFAGTIVFGLIDNPACVSNVFNGENGELYKIIALSLMGVLALFMLIAFANVSAKKLYGADVVRSVLQVLIGGGLIYVAFTMMESLLLWAAIATGVALVHLLIEIIVLSARKPKKAKAVKEAKPVEVAEPVQEEIPMDIPVQEEVVEEEIVEEEAVEEVEEEVEQLPIYVPAPAPAPVAVAPAPAVNDYYDSKAFDAFISTLSAEERNQFTELFILKYKGEMAGVPDYNVGGDNKEFFQKIFINLGSLRERLSDDLLEKLYQFAIRQ